MGKRFTIIGIGEILWDVFPDGKKLGGAPFNFAWHAEKTGLTAGIVSAVGDDDYGNEIMDILGQTSIINCIEIHPELPTGHVSVKLGQTGIPDYIIHENTAWDHIRLTGRLLKFAEGVDAVCFGTLCQRNSESAATVKSFLQHTKPESLRVFDINLRQNFYSEKIISDLLYLSDILKLNDEELKVVSLMFGVSGEETRILTTLLERFSLKLIVLTKGKEGSRLFAGVKRSSQMKPPSIDIVDTVGAGDSFTAVVVYGILTGLKLEDIHHMANRVAGFVCGKKGATPEYILADILEQPP